MRKALLGGCIAVAACILGVVSQVRAEPPYRSPFEVAFSPDGRGLAITDHTAGVVVLADADGARVSAEIRLNGHPAGIVFSDDGDRLYVAEFGLGTVAEIEIASGKIERRLVVEAWPLGIGLAPRRNLLLSANFAANTVRVVELASGKKCIDIPVPRQPFAVAVTPDESLAVVSNHLPHLPATDPDQAAVITLIDLERRSVVKNLALPAGSSCVRDVAISPDGRRAYVVHTVGRTNLPTTQVERGWINTNGLSVIDLQSRKRIATVLLDYLLEGAADPWGLAISPDGCRLWVTLSGVHQLVSIDLRRLSAVLEAEHADLENDLAALTRAGVIERRALPGNGSRGIAVSPDGLTLAVAMFFSGQVALLDANSGETRGVITLANQPVPDAARRGERIFHDATYCKQGWLSCATCHPDGRVDGLNWDLLNDGLGNPKNARSLLWSDRTPPMMSRGVRSSMDAASAAGFRHIAFQNIGERELADVRSFLCAMEPAVSPFRKPDGSLSVTAARGRQIYHHENVGCAHCHPEPLLTNLESYDVGTRGVLDRSDTFDTPTLVELWRTGPYLHDGSAASLREVLTERNRDDRHGKTSQLSEKEIEDLIAYLLSL